MYEVLPSFVLGFHGCDEAVAEAVFAGRDGLKKSENDYDWLGHGVYFWENNPARALAFAQHLRDAKRSFGPRISKPAVVGAVIDLGRCLNLLDHEMIALVRDSHDKLLEAFKLEGSPPPKNTGGPDLLQRRLDCAVLEFLHYLREATMEPFDSVRGVFVEGPELYQDSGFHERSHIQVCVRNMKCIKGYFRVLPDPEA